MVGVVFYDDVTDHVHLLLLLLLVLPVSLPAVNFILTLDYTFTDSIEEDQYEGEIFLPHNCTSFSAQNNILLDFS